MNRIVDTIEYAEFSWNPVSGCAFGCFYCYARRFAEGRLRELYLANKNVAPGFDPADPFAPRFWPERLDEPKRRKKPTRVLVVDMGDLFGPWVPRSWVMETLNVARECHWHTFIFLTKFPFEASQFDFPQNAWVGTTIEKDFRPLREAGLHKVKAIVRFISAEPLLGRISRLPNWVDWLIIGGQTGPNAITPNAEWVEELLALAEKAHIPVFLKRNLAWKSLRQEWPRPKRPTSFSQLRLFA